MTERQGLRIGIIGAGMGGLTAAIALQKFGFRPKIYEQSPVLGEVGAGLTISPNASRVFNFLGLGDEIATICFTPQTQLVRHYKTGAILMRTERGDIPLKQYGSPYYCIHRADLHSLLVRTLQKNDPESIVLNSKLKEAIATNDGAKAVFADGSTVELDVLIGADGVRSVVRDTVFGSPPPKFTGHVAWRALVQRDALPKDVGDSLPGIHVGPGQLFVRYPLRHNTIFNYVAFAHDENWTNDSWTARSKVSDVVEAFAGWDRFASEILKATPPEGCFKWALFIREALDTWQSGCVTLMGDAAHGMLPFMGQGAASSIEDGMVLARCLASFSDPVEAIKRYEAARREYATFIQSKSANIVSHLQSADPDSFGDKPFENEEALGLFSYDAVTVAI